MEDNTELGYISTLPYTPSWCAKGKFLPLIYQHDVVYKKTVILVSEFCCFFYTLPQSLLTSVSSSSQRIIELVFYMLQFWLKPGNKNWHSA